jgi:hypothetical protein
MTLVHYLSRRFAVLAVAIVAATSPMLAVGATATAASSSAEERQYLVAGRSNALPAPAAIAAAG